MLPSVRIDSAVTICHVVINLYQIATGGVTTSD
jgi:hypothetical protein